MTIISSLPDAVAELVHQHLEAAYAAEVLSSDSTAPRAVRDARKLVHTLNATNAYLLAMLGQAHQQTALDAITFVADALEDPDHCAEWVVEQLVNVGVDLGELAGRAKASAVLGDIARALLDGEPNKKPATTVTVRGRSDDLIEIGDDLVEEFNVLGDEYDLVSFPDGTVLRVEFDRDGVWRITPLYRGHGTLTIEQAHGDDARTDIATLVFDAPAVWAMHGTSVATLRRPVRR
ncbi:MAG TPA: hypothetical protein VGF17_11590 [Phytomonospora sp.]